MNIANLFKLKQAKTVFFKNHPKLPDFLDQVKKKNFAENTEIAISLRIKESGTYPIPEILPEFDDSRSEIVTLLRVPFL